MNNQTKILIVDDEEDILKVVKYNLQNQGYSADTAVSGERALRKIKTDPPELLILDLMLPGISGLEICRIVRNDPKMKHIPILMLTAKGEESDIVTGLELGADDYMTKPFSMSVLIARIHALERRHSTDGGDGKIIQNDVLRIDADRREVKVHDKLIDLTFTEFQILHHLASHPGLVFTRNQIIDAVRGDNYFVTERSVDFQLVGLRKKLGEAGKMIKTVRGVGYQFKETTSN
ncbi:MAG: response regulator [Fidelibacterota bacterium]